MPDKKISELTELTLPDVSDLLPIVDVSVSGGTRRITAANLFGDQGAVLSPTFVDISMNMTPAEVAIDKALMSDDVKGIWWKDTVTGNHMVLSMSEKGLAMWQKDAEAAFFIQNFWFGVSSAGAGHYMNDFVVIYGTDAWPRSLPAQIGPAMLGIYSDITSGTIILGKQAVGNLENFITMYNNASVLKYSVNKDGWIGVGTLTQDVPLELALTGNPGTPHIKLTTGDIISQATMRAGDPINNGLIFATGDGDINLEDRVIITRANGYLGVNIFAALAGQAHIDQDDAGANIPVIVLDQADISEGFINFIGSDRGVIGEGVNSVESVRVELGGVVRRLALYGDA